MMTALSLSLSNLIAKVPMKGNRSFHLKLQTGLQFALRASVGKSTLIWHRRMGHLNVNSLKFLQEKEMVLGLPKIKNTNEVCEGCILGKHCRDSFPRVSRASTHWNWYTHMCVDQCKLSQRQEIDTSSPL